VKHTVLKVGDNPKPWLVIIYVIKMRALKVHFLSDFYFFYDQYGTLVFLLYMNSTHFSVFFMSNKTEFRVAPNLSKL